MSNAGPTSIGLLAGIATGALAPVDAVAQTPRPPVLYEWTSATPTIFTAYGKAVAGLGDVDGDGAPDVAVGDPLATINGVSDAGRIYVYSGRTGGVLRTVDGTLAQEVLGVRLSAVEDLDGDGAADLLAVAEEWPTAQQLIHTVRLYSGRTGTRLHTFRNYYGATGLGDVDRDGWPDILLGSSDPMPGGLQGAGEADLVSGRDFTLLRQFRGRYVDEQLTPAGRAGDVDGDGHADVLLVSLGSWPSTGTNGAWVYSGRTFQLLRRFPPRRGGDTYGQSTSGVGDVDADGFDDVAVSDNGDRLSVTYGHLDVFSGRSGSLLFTLDVPTSARSPHIYGVRAAGDVDGDGFDDVLWGARGGYFWIHSGRDQRMLAEMSIPGSNGRAMAGVGDVDGDEFPDVCVGPFTRANRPPAFVRVYSGAMQGVATLGVGCPDQDGVIPRIGATGSPRLGTTVELHVSRVHTAQTAVLLLGFSATQWGALSLPFDLAPLGLSGCLLRTSVEFFLPTTTTGIIPEKGHATFPVTIPFEFGLRGVDLHAQWLLFGRGAPGRIGSTTRALTASIF